MNKGIILALCSAFAIVILSVEKASGATGLLDNVPEAAIYNLVYEFSIPITSGGWASAPVPYTVDDSGLIEDGAFSRVAYYLEAVKTTGETQWVYVAMSAFTDDASRLGVPRNYVLRNGLYDTASPTNATIRSNVPGITTGDNIDTVNLEFWPSNYGGNNEYGVPGAASIFDFGDGGASSSPGHGSMQIHNYGAGETIFAYNAWGAVRTSEFGIGSQPVDYPDWTFNSSNISTYSTRTLQILVIPELDVENLSSTNVTDTSGWMNAKVTTPVSTCDVYVYWGDVNQGDNASLWADNAFVGTYSNGIFDVTYPSTGLTGGVTNWYTFMISNDVRMVWGEPSGYFVTSTAPSVNNDAGAVVSEGRAVLQGNLTAGNTSDIYIYWGREDGGQSRDYENVIKLTDVVEGGFSSEIIAGHGFDYYYICLASNAVGEAWAPVSKSFALPLPEEGFVYENGLRGSMFQPTSDTSNVVDLIGASYTNSLTRVFTGGKAGTILTMSEISAKNIVLTGAASSWAEFGGAPGDHFVAALSGRYFPPVSGIYNFRWSQDDRGWMFMDLNDDGVFSAAEAVGDWAWSSSGNVTLTAGQGYNFMFFSQEFGGYDNLAFWYTPSGGAEAYVNPTVQSGQWQYASDATPPPGVSPTEASDVTASTATLNGELVGSGWAFDVNAFWGKTDETATPGNWDENGFVGAFYDWDGAVDLSINSLDADTLYFYTFNATNLITNVWAESSSTFITGEVTAQALDSSATEATDDNGVFRITRPLSTTNGALNVYYSIGGSAVNGDDYAALSGSVVIPEGAASVDVVISPVEDVDWSEGDESVTLTLQPGGYIIGTAGAVSVTLHDSGSPDLWAHRIPLMFNGYRESETLENFPALVKLGENISGFNYDDFLSGEYGDLRFTDDSMTRALNYDVESWDTNGISEVWVQIPELANNTTIWILWGRSGVTAPVYTYDGSTWSQDYAAVYHLAETNQATVVKDSSPYGNTLGTYGGVQLGAEGLAGPAGAWDGNNDWLQRPATDSIQSMGQLTLQTWFYDEKNDTAARGLISKRTDSGTDRSYYWFKYQNRNLYWYIGSGGGEFANTQTEADRWTFAAGTYDMNLSTNRMKMYLDGQFRSERHSGSGYVPWTESALHIGILNADYGAAWQGKLDEVRISRAARSPLWLRTEYLNMISNSIFQTCSGTGPSLTVDGSWLQYGAPTPSYGTTNLVGGEILTCTAPEVVDLGDGVGYGCVGYQVYSNLVDLVRTGSGNSCTYTNSGTADRLVWLWEKQYYVALTNNGTGGFSIPSGWYFDNTQLVCTATATGDGIFAGWLDDQGEVPAWSAFEEISISVTNPVSYTAVFLSPFSPSGWAKQIAIDFDGYDRAEVLTNFPVMIKLSDNLADFFYYSDMSSPADAGDLRFASQDGTELFYEIETWNTNGTSIIWVCMPRLSQNDNRIYAYWKNPLHTDPPVYTANGITWNNGYVAVYHLAEESGDFMDSSPYVNGLSVENSVLPGAQGIAGTTARWPDGTNDWLEASSNDSLHGMGQLTLQSWFYDEINDDNPRGLISKRTSSSSGISYYFFKYTSSRLLYFQIGRNDGTASYGGSFSGTATGLNEWYFAAATYDKTLPEDQMKVYLNGDFKSARDAAGDIDVNNSPLTIGILNRSYGRSWWGKLDEVRISRSARSEDWLWAEYMNIKNHDTSLSYHQVSGGTLLIIR